MIEFMKTVGIWIFSSMLWFMKVDEHCIDLCGLLQHLESKVTDIERQLRIKELKPGMKRRRVVEVFLGKVNRYKEEAEKTLERFQESRWKWERMWLMLSIQQHLREGKDLLDKAAKYQNEGLTGHDICTRGPKLPVGELMGETAHRHLRAALQKINNGDHYCIGIYGLPWAGKTNLMKHLYNKVYDDLEGFKAVLWASESFDNKGLQESVAKAMCFNLEDNDEVRRASLLEERLTDLGPGRVILFVDNIRKKVRAYDLLGIPSPKAQRILVFTSPSADVCNMMRCDHKFEMGLLPEKEAQELFIHEAGLNHQDAWIQELIVDLVKECARMPLAIILIARAMMGVEDIREWRNRLCELKGKIKNTHDEEGKILEQLTFSYSCLNDKTFQRCFLASAESLTDNCQVPKQEIVDHWIEKKLIRSRSDPQLAYDQGHAILNKLKRMCLLEVVTLDGSDYVGINKWIKKMAASVTCPEGD